MRSALFFTLSLALAASSGLAASSDAERAAEEALRHYRNGQEALNTEHFAEAEQEFKEAIRLDPLLVAAHYGLGRTYMALKQYPDAVQAYVACRDAFHQEDANAMSNRQTADMRILGQIKALENDMVAAQRAAGGGTAQNQRIQMAIDRNEEQIRTLRSMMGRGQRGPAPTPHWLSLALGSAYFRIGDFPGAEREYRAALEAKSDLGEAHQNLAVVCMLTGRFDEAEQQVTLAEKAGFKVPQGLKNDIRKRREAAGKQ